MEFRLFKREKSTLFHSMDFARLKIEYASKAQVWVKFKLYSSAVWFALQLFCALVVITIVWWKFYVLLYFCSLQPSTKVLKWNLDKLRAQEPIWGGFASSSSQKHIRNNKKGAFLITMEKREDFKCATHTFIMVKWLAVVLWRMPKKRKTERKNV